MTLTDKARQLGREKREKRQSRKRSELNGVADGDHEEHLTDLGNAKLLVRQHGADLRYCHPWRKWLVWCGTHWRLDDTLEIVRRAKLTVKSMYAQVSNYAKAAQQAADEETKLRLADKAKQLLIHATKSSHGQAIARMVCAECHAVDARQTLSPNGNAPAFGAVAKTSGMTAMALRTWLQTSHPTMPNIILTSDDRDNVIAYILSLNDNNKRL